MSWVFILLAMIFLHVVDDYKLQSGLLAFLKQKSYWKENAPDELYRRDYIMALAMHGMSWSFMIMLPLAMKAGFNVGYDFLAVYIFNAVCHAYIDDAKANRYKINLIVDQTFHLVQILGTFLLFI